MKSKVVSLAKRSVKRLVKDASLGLLFPLMYKYFSRKPVARGRVLFLETKETEMPDSFDLMFRRLQEDPGKSPRYLSLNQNHVSHCQYLKNCVNALHDISRVEVVFLSDASDLVSCIDLRPETRVVQLWHACGAFKKWGMSTADLKFGGNRKQLLRHPFYKNLSLVTVSSPEVVWAYEKAMVLGDQPGVVRPLGVSRTDKFFDEHFIAQSKSNVEEAVPKAKGKKVLLYAPTFRGRVSQAQGPDKLDIAGLKDALEKEWVLLIKHHPFVKKTSEIPEDCSEFAIDVSNTLPIDELLCVADACVSDYSSLVFEYSLFGRPMAFFAYDVDDYCDWRGFYYDYDSLTPGPVFRENAELIDYLTRIPEIFDVQRVRSFRDKFMSACDGHSTERIYEEVFVPPLDSPGKKKAYDLLSNEDPLGIDVSIVVPAYNAGSKIGKCIESILAQTYPKDRMQVVITDDCSSDETWEVVKSYADRYPGLFDVERFAKPSGSPSRPRNCGLERSKGKFVFFLDADDWLGPEAIERMLDHAVEWQSDVLLVKLIGENGRETPRSMFTHNQPKADIRDSKICWTFAPLKLFRRDLIADIRFPDDMPEDIPFVLESYLRAKVISVAADYDYYHVSWDSADEHVSVSTWDDPHSNIRVYKRILNLIEMYGLDYTELSVLQSRLRDRDYAMTCRVLASSDIELSSEEKSILELIGNTERDLG